MPLMDTGNKWVWHALKLYLPAGTRLTSVYRPPQAQLDFIVRTARKHGYKFDRIPLLHDSQSWAGALEFVRKKGYKVAAPGRSAHQRGVAYDFTGPNLDLIKKALQKAADARRITLVPGSRSALIIERTNNCVHAEIESALIDHDPFDFA
jgi:hypothetical protein